jgi:hypothetical protein
MDLPICPQAKNQEPKGPNTLRKGKGAYEKQKQDIITGRYLSNNPINYAVGWFYRRPAKAISNPNERPIKS